MTGITPPAVDVRKISSARWIRSTVSPPSWNGMSSSSQMSNTVRRVIPSSMPRSGVRTTPEETAKTLKPGPSVTRPSPSVMITVSAPRS